MFHNIMLPLDGSELAENALEKAVGLARLSQARLHLVRAQEYPDTIIENRDEFPTLHGYYEQEKADCQVYLDRVKAKLGEGVTVEVHLISGESPTQALLTFARQHQIDLIVAASHGRTGVTRWLLGSVAEKLARLSPCPVMIVRGEAPEESSPN